MACRGMVQDASVTIGTSVVTLLSTDPSRTYLLLANQHASNTAYFSFTNTSPAAATAGCFSLAAGVTMQFAEVVPTNPLYAIASSTGTEVTCQYIDGGTYY